MAFHVGQKVVCVDPVEDLIREGQIYEIAAINGKYVYIDQPGLARGGWLPMRFRPVVERKTDISIFTAMLNPNHVGETV